MTTGARLGFLLLVAALLQACGGGSGGGSDAGSGGNGGPAPTQTAQFVDNPVEGLQFFTASQQGLTNRQGELRHRDGETLNLRIGDVQLGSAAISSVMTPLDFAPNGDINHPIATNIARTLQTLDTDCDPANGITISAQARQTASALMP